MPKDKTAKQAEKARKADEEKVQHQALNKVRQERWARISPFRVGNVVKAMGAVGRFAGAVVKGMWSTKKPFKKPWKNVLLNVLLFPLRVIGTVVVGAGYIAATAATAFGGAISAGIVNGLWTIGTSKGDLRKIGIGLLKLVGGTAIAGGIAFAVATGVGGPAIGAISAVLGPVVGQGAAALVAGAAATGHAALASTASAAGIAAGVALKPVVTAAGLGTVATTLMASVSGAYFWQDQQEKKRIEKENKLKAEDADFRSKPEVDPSIAPSLKNLENAVQQQKNNPLMNSTGKSIQNMLPQSTTEANKGVTSSTRPPVPTKPVPPPPVSNHNNTQGNKPST